MSASHLVYVGIFLEAKLKPMKVLGRTVCSNNDEHRFNVFHDTNFCPICGAPVTQAESDGFMSFYSLDDDTMGFDVEDVEKILKKFGPIYGGESSEADVEFLYSNHDRLWTQFIDDDKGDTDIDLAALVTDPKQAEELLHDDIQLLLKTIATSVKVRFGVISSWG